MSLILLYGVLADGHMQTFDIICGFVMFCVEYFTGQTGMDQIELYIGRR